MKLVFDIETNGLDHSVIWCIAAKDIQTDKSYYYTDQDNRHPAIREGLELLSQASALIGHNIISFDLPALTKHHGWTPSPEQKLVDTMLMSQLNDFYRPGLAKAAARAGKGTHAMKTYGIAMGQLKEDDPEWDVYSPEMQSRCESDVDINIKIYLYLLKETKAIMAVTPGYAQALNTEHDFSQAAAEHAKNGWMLDIKAAHSLVDSITPRMDEIESTVVPHLAPRKVFLDSKPREVTYLADGVTLDRVSRAWFADKPLASPYRRFKMVETGMGNHVAITQFLLDHGWTPTTYNMKVDKETGRRSKGTPKLTEDSYATITGELGKLVGEYRTISHRKSFIEGLLRNVREDGRVSGSAFTLGTNTHRVRHRGIVNVPGVDAVLGKEVRSLFIAPKGRKLVSADSDSNQLRGFAHYLNNKEVSLAVADGTESEGTDVHSRTAGIVGITRKVAKNVTYALLFGAKDAKLADTAGRKGDGDAIRRDLRRAFPGFEELTAKVEDEWAGNEMAFDQGFVTGLDGRRVFCESRKAFNALLQAFEVVTCKEACNQSQRMIRDEGLDAQLVLHYHDEYTYEVADKDVERVGEIMEYSLGEYITKLYNLNTPMGGTAASGPTWAEVH